MTLSSDDLKLCPVSTFSRRLALWAMKAKEPCVPVSSPPPTTNMVMDTLHGNSTADAF